MRVDVGGLNAQRRMQGFLQRSHAVERVVVGRGVIHRIHACAERFEEEGDVAIAATDVERGVVADHFQQRAGVAA